MTGAAAPDQDRAADRRAAEGALSPPAGFVLLVALLCAAALTAGRTEIVWRTGAFFDPDDAMRAVQLRDFLAGQSWFDLTAHRLDPPEGLPMHWSRIVDLPLAALDLFFSHFLAPEYAERATRLVFPFALLAALLAAAGWLGSILSGAAARLAAIWLAMLSGPMFLQFAPGRIDHHAPQIVTLALAFGLFLQGLAPGRAARLSGAAALMALSIAISLENLPFFAVMIAALPFFFIVDGDGRPLLCFAAGALAAFPAFYVAINPSAAYLVSACDAFSFVHLAAFCVGASALAVVGWFAPRLRTVASRVAAIAAAAVATAATLLFAPQCVGDPLGAVDPLLRDLWLSHVVEAKPLLSLYPAAPGMVAAVAAPVALGLAAALAFAWKSSGRARRRWLLTAAVVAIGFAAGMWQMRVFTSVTPIAMVPLAAAIVVLVERVPASGALRFALAAVAAILISPIGLALAFASKDDAPAVAERACLAPEMFEPLASLPASRVAASFDLGSHILAHTPHSVFAAPYHRDNRGNRVVADAFTASPEAAEAILRKAGAGLVVWCAKAKESSLVSAAPNGLAAMLARGEAPSWLERKSDQGASLLVFAVRPVR